MLKAQSLSFPALVDQEQLGANEQALTFFHTVDGTVQRLDKARLVFPRPCSAPRCTSRTGQYLG